MCRTFKSSVVKVEQRPRLANGLPQIGDAPQTHSEVVSLQNRRAGRSLNTLSVKVSLKQSQRRERDAHLPDTGNADSQQVNLPRGRYLEGLKKTGRQEKAKKKVWATD
jgi:hypothetical protein